MQHPYVITISSEKGGVGKTTLATNLAIYLKALEEDLPITLFSFDNHFSVDRMFRIGNGCSQGSVANLFSATGLNGLVETGQYGVQFISSCHDLENFGRGIDDVSLLVRALAKLEMPGIVIIDTRPTLDIFTRNAIFAADRVIVPVKDAPSLENCKYLYTFCEQNGLSKGILRLLPCLIDSRIRYSGPFKDAYQLLKAYAINRGYRCLEGFIAKSPKVESLNTNPEGKIYPILTHGRGTNVHLQYSHLARQVLLGYKACTEPRVAGIYREMRQKEAVREETHRTLSARLNGKCLICGNSLHSRPAEGSSVYYCETSDKGKAGFLEEECFADLVFRHFYSSQKEITPTNPLRELFRESSRRSFFAIGPISDGGNYEQARVSFSRFDDRGREISRKVIELREFQSRFILKERTRLYKLAAETFLDEKGAPTGRFLLIRRIEGGGTGEILVGEPRQHFDWIMARVAGNWS